MVKDYGDTFCKEFAFPITYNLILENYIRHFQNKRLIMSIPSMEEVAVMSSVEQLVGGGALTAGIVIALRYHAEPACRLLL